MHAQQVKLPDLYIDLKEDQIIVTQCPLEVGAKVDSGNGRARSLLCERFGIANVRAA